MNDWNNWGQQPDDAWGQQSAHQTNRPFQLLKTAFGKGLFGVFLVAALLMLLVAVFWHSTIPLVKDVGFEVSPVLTATPAAQALAADASPLPSVNPSLVPSSAFFAMYPITTRYYYHQLTDRQKALFSILYDELCGSSLPSYSAQQFDATDYERAYFVIHNDCPELFLCASGADALQAEANYQAILAKLNEIPKSPDFFADDYAKELSIYQFIIANTEYRMDQEYSVCACGPLLYGYAQCSGYSKALSLMLRFYGIPSVEVYGLAYDQNGVLDPLGHAWNIVSINGQWYQCDATWDDTSAPDGIGQSEAVFLPFLNVTDGQMSVSRFMDEALQRDWKIPACTSTADNFYVRQGSRVPSGGDCYALLEVKLSEAYQTGSSIICLDFENAADFRLILLSLSDIMYAWQASNGSYVSGYRWAFANHANLLMLHDIRFAK